MKCPTCHKSKNSVSDTRKYGSYTTRRRVCKCGHKFTTREVYLDQLKNLLEDIQQLSK